MKKKERKDYPFGRNLAFELKSRHWSPEDIANESGIAKTTIYSVLNGNDCSYRTMRAISNTLKISLGELVSEEWAQIKEETKNDVKIDNRLKNIIIQYYDLSPNKQDKVFKLIENIVSSEYDEVRIESNSARKLERIAKDSNLK
jgi:transcriptional regulator with XRE-family HTH domain